MAQNDSPDLIAGTIADTAARLALWAGRAPSGLARVEFTSEFARQRVVDQLRADVVAQGVPFHEIALPLRCPAIEAVRELMARLGSLEASVVSITGFATAFPTDVPLVDSLRVLNYNRENLALYPLRQVWWLTRAFVETFIQAVPDLNSWFMVRLRLTEIVEGTRRGATERVEIRSALEVDEARRRSVSLVNRFRQALGQGASTHDLIDLAHGAVQALLAVSAIGEAHALAEALLPEIAELAAKLHQEPATADLARTFERLAGLWRARGIYSEAEPLYHHALKVREHVLGPTHSEIARSLDDLGEVYYEQRRLVQAIEVYQRSIALKRGVGDRVGEGLILNDLGLVFQRQGRYDEALDAYGQALAIRRTFEDRAGEGAIQNNLGIIYQLQGRYDEALDAYGQALAICREFGDCNGEGKVFNNLGYLYQLQGRYDEALDSVGQALTICRKFEDRISEGQTLGNLAVIWADQGNHANALELGRQAVAILRTTECLPDLTTMRNLVARWEGMVASAEGRGPYT